MNMHGNGKALNKAIGVPPEPPEPEDVTPEDVLPRRSDAVIPKRLAVVWIGPHDPPEERIFSWRDAHPDWEFQIIQNHEGWANQHVIDAIMTRERNWEAPVCDVIRWELLSSSKGMIVVDADSMCLRPLDGPARQGEATVDLFSHEAWVHFENEAKFAGRIACNAMGASPRAEVFARCVEEVGKVDITKVQQGKMREAVGAGLLMRVAHKLPRERLTVFPSRMFVPVHETGARAPDVTAHGQRIELPTFAEQGHGYRRGYNSLRKWPCQCEQCRKESHGMFPPWQ